MARWPSLIMSEFYLIFERPLDDKRWSVWGAAPNRAFANLRAMGHTKQDNIHTRVRRVELPDELPDTPTHEFLEENQ